MIEQSEDFPLDGAIIVGVGTRLVRDGSRLFIPLGLSIGRRIDFEDSSLSLVPYAQPVLMPNFGDGPGDDLAVALGLGADLRISRRFEIRFAIGIGDIEDFSIGVAFGDPDLEQAIHPLLAPAEVEALASPPLPFPVAVKLESPDVPHKTEAGAVRLGVQDLAGLKQAAREVVSAATRYRPGARIEGLLIQEMAAGLEVIVGAVNDPTFGPTVAFGLGGVLTELLRDVTHGFAPLDAETARAMIGEVRGAALLNGYRGRPALDVAALADALTRVSLLIADHADRIAEIDVNPLFVMERGVVAADALIVLK